MLTTSEVTDTEADSNSKVANWRLWVFIEAFVNFTLGKLMDIYYGEVEERIAASRIHTKDWYRDQALAYQHGHELGERATYDNSNRNDKEVLDAKIVTHAAVQRAIINGRGVLRIKTAKGYNGNLVPLLPEELAPFTVYINKVADAGTTVLPTSGVHDDLKLEIDIYYDASIMDNTGKLLDGSSDTPLIDAINDHLTGIKFNGQLALTRLTDTAQEVRGVILPVIKNAWSRYGSYAYDTEGIPNVGVIDELRTADAGYMRLDEATTVINYMQHND